MAANSAQSGAVEEASNDLELVHATKNGDISAFEQLVERYDTRLIRIAHNVTHNHEDAQDAVQEAFLKAFQHLDRFREDSKFSTWLIRITVNQALMKLRKQRSMREVSLDEDYQADEKRIPFEVADWSPSPEERYGSSELRSILITALQTLSPILRTVFVLRDMEGFSIVQTTEILGLSQTAVKARLWRARLQLRERLADYFRKPIEVSRTDKVSSRRNVTEPLSFAIRSVFSGDLPGAAPVT
jgi:RNA polymerase sigma-70 factor (ECF subfamily)